MDKKIKAIKCYQSVMFNKCAETYFSVMQQPNKPKVELSFDSELHAVEVKSDSEVVLIPLTNVAFIQVWGAKDDEVMAEKEAAKHLKVGIKNSEIKRPR